MWMKHEILHLQTPDLDFPEDLTVCVDVESNPGDTELAQDSRSSFSSRSSNPLSRIVYGRSGYHKINCWVINHRF